MSLDLPQFYRACNPSTTLDASDAEGRKYYIDFSAVRSQNLIDELQANITLFSPDVPTCQLFTGHIGCGKSTELLRLKSILEAEDFHVVYFESSQSLDLSDTDIGEILLSIASQLSQTLDRLEMNPPFWIWKSLLQEVEKIWRHQFAIKDLVLMSDFDDGMPPDQINPGFGHLDLLKIARSVTNNPEFRSKLRQYLEPRISLLIEAINTELLDPLIHALEKQGKKGLVMIVDNLDRLEALYKPWGRSQPEYLFVDRGEQLCKLNCHMVYTIPLTLIFSKDFGRLTQRFGSDPKVLPAIPVRDRWGKIFQPGILQLQQMVLARGFPDVPSEQRLAFIPQVFTDAQTLERLCYISGGHARNLLRLLHRWIEKERQLPLSKPMLEMVIQERHHQLVLSLDDPEKEVLRQVAKSKAISSEENVQFLLRNLFIFEYQDEEGSWFDINPILSESQEFLG